MRRYGLIFSTFLCVTLVTISISTAASEWEENSKVGQIFKDAEAKGTFVLYNVSAKTYAGYNKDRAEKRFVPASTFKIANSIIGLSTGAVKDVDETLPYKGSPKPFIKTWARDMGLREAIAISNVPIYQELARRIGLERMRAGVVRMDYGNKEIGTIVDTFWLSGPLKISALEQARFLARLAQGALPFPRDFQLFVQDICLQETNSNWKLYGKTGWENAPGEGVGWWVGWVLKEGHVYAFALNMDIHKESDAIKRMELGKASLKALGIL